MGLIKGKPILTNFSFKHDQLRTINMQLSSVQHKTLPFVEDDVKYTKKQPIFWSANTVLEKLLENDKIIDNFISTRQDYSSISAQLSSSLKISNYDSLTSIDDVYSSSLSSHITDYHSVPMQILEDKYLQTDCSNLKLDLVYDNFQKRYPEKANLVSVDTISIKNDILVETEFSDSLELDNNYIKVFAHNKKTNNTFKSKLNGFTDLQYQIPSLDNVPYIYKKWLSGLKELYIYLPTTFTFYNENVDGENVKDNMTFICVQINRRHFQFNHFYTMQICGQSLPLQIHNTESEYFNDVIEPSIVRSFCISKNKETNTDSIYSNVNDLYTLYFCCYGTDAQAIRLIGD